MLAPKVFHPHSLPLPEVAKGLFLVWFYRKENGSTEKLPAVPQVAQLSSGRAGRGSHQAEWIPSCPGSAQGQAAWVSLGSLLKNAES